MTLTSRAHRGEEDFRKVRELLIESYAITKETHNWWIERWAVFRYGGQALEEIAGTRQWEADVRMWETESGKLVGVTHPEGGGDVHLQVHPHYRHIEAQMLAWAEEHHRTSRPEGARDWPLHTFARADDSTRAALLTCRGYRSLGPCGYTRWRSLDMPIPDVELPPGYVVRDMHGAEEADLEQRAAINNAAFNSTKSTAETVRVLQKASAYHHSLDLVAIAPDGAFASFCVVWYGEANRIGWFEPVGTHPDHRRRKLASAVICEGMRRIKALGATTAYVGSGYDAPANRLYETLGFTSHDLYHCWRKGF